MTTDAYHHMFDNRVRFAETDAQGVTFYGSYVTYQDEASLQYFREVGFAYEDMLDGDWEVFVVHTDLDFHASAKFGDVLRNEIRVEKIGHSSITFDYRCLLDETGDLLADGSMVLVAVDPDGESIRVPDAFREAVIAYQDVPPDPV